MKTAVEVVRPLEGLRLLWGVKESFRQYVQGVGGFTEIAGSGREGDRYAFPFVDADADGSVLLFGGGIRFSAHGGALAVTIREPWLHLSGEDYFLSIDAGGSARTRLARLGSPDPDSFATSSDEVRLPAELLAEGSATFDFTYPPGTALDPVFVALPSELLGWADGRLGLLAAVQTEEQQRSAINA